MESRRQREGDEGGGGGERVAEEHVEKEGECGDEVGRGVPHALREGLHPDIAAQHGELVAAEAGDALEEGLLPGLQLDQLHALERLGGGVDAAVLHLHELALNGGQLLADEARHGDHEQHHCHARQRRGTQLRWRRRRAGTCRQRRTSETMIWKGPDQMVCR